jgi:spectrin beta
MDEIQVKKTQVEMRFEQLKAPLLDRQRQLEKKKEAFQVGSCHFIMVVLKCCF